jgi:hypothetical protein
MLVHLREAPGYVPPGPGFLPRVDKRGGMGSQVAKSWLPTLILGWRRDDVDYSRDWFFLG